MRVLSAEGWIDVDPSTLRDPVMPKASGDSPGVGSGIVDALQGMGWNTLYAGGDVMRAAGLEQLGKAIVDRASRGVEENRPTTEGFSREGVEHVLGQGLGSVGLGLAAGALSGPAAPIVAPAVMGLSALAQSYAGSRQEQERHGETARGRAALAAIPSAAIETVLGPERAAARLAAYVGKEGLETAARSAPDAIKNLGWKGVGKEFVKQGAVENVEELLQMPFEQWGGRGMEGLSSEALTRGMMETLSNAPNVFVGAGLLGGGMQMYQNRRADALKALKDDLAAKEVEAQSAQEPTFTADDAGQFDLFGGGGTVTAPVTDTDYDAALREAAARERLFRAKQPELDLEPRSGFDVLLGSPEGNVFTQPPITDDIRGPQGSLFGDAQDEQLTALAARTPPQAPFNLVSESGGPALPFETDPFGYTPAPPSGDAASLAMFGPKGGVTQAARQAKLDPVQALLNDIQPAPDLVDELPTPDTAAQAIAPKAPVVPDDVLQQRMQEIQAQVEANRAAEQARREETLARLKAESEAARAAETERLSKQAQPAPEPTQETRNDEPSVVPQDDVQRPESPEVAQGPQNAEAPARTEGPQASENAEVQVTEPKALAQQVAALRKDKPDEWLNELPEPKAMAEALAKLDPKVNPKTVLRKGIPALAKKLADKGDTYGLQKAQAPAQKVEGAPTIKQAKAAATAVPKTDFASMFGVKPVKPTEVPDAVQESVAEEVDVRQRAEDGGAVEQGNTQGQEVAGESNQAEVWDEEAIANAWEAGSDVAETRPYDTLKPHQKADFKRRLESGEDFNKAARGALRASAFEKPADKRQRAAAMLRDPKERERLDGIMVEHRVWDAEEKKWVPQEMSALKALEDIQSDLTALEQFKQCLEG